MAQIIQAHQSMKSIKFSPLQDMSHSMEEGSQNDAKAANCLSDRSELNLYDFENKI